MIVDTITMSMTSTAWGTSGGITLNIYKSPFKYSASNASHLDPNDYNPAGDIYQDGTGSYFTSPAINRSQTVTFDLPADYLQHIRDGYLLACYRRSTAATPTASQYTREFTEAPILTVTYHSPITMSTFSLSTSSLDAGQTITANITRADSTYTHTVIFSFGSASNEYYNITTSKAYAVPLDWLYQIPNSLSGTASCRVVVYKDGAYIGEAPTQYFTVTVPANVKPYITGFTYTVVDGYAGGLCVQGYSKAQLTVSGATGAYWSSIVGYSVGGGSTNPYTTGILYTTTTFYATVTDSRGRVSDALPCTVTVTPYSIPNVTSILVQRTNSGGTLADEGDYCKVTPTYTWSAIGSNTRTTAIHVRELPSGSFYSVSGSLLASGGYVLLGPGYAIDKAYEIRLTVDDSISGPVYGFGTLYTAKYIMDYKAGGDGVAFGQVSTRKGLEVAPDWPLYANGERIGGTFGENQLINPEFLINQRGASSVLCDGTWKYYVDRWRFTGYGSATVVPNYDGLLSQTGMNDVTLMQIQVNEGGANIQQVIENLYWGYYADSNIVFSCWINSAQASTIYFQDTYFGLPQYGWTHISVKRPQTDAVFRLWLGTPGLYNITLPKAEYGTVPTKFARRPYPLELAMCQRYFLTTNFQGVTYSAVGTGRNSSETLCYVLVPTPVTMRTAPTVSMIGYFNILDNFGVHAVSSVEYNRISSNMVKIVAWTTGLNPGNYAMMEATDSWSASIWFDAEIY